MTEGNPIVYKKTLSGEADIVQREVMEEAFTKTQDCIDSYKKLPASHNGMFINADLFKEIFTKYSNSPEARKKYDLSVHNSSAWLSQKLFEQMIDDPSIKGCIFLTGVPGAGKTIYIQSLFNAGKVPKGYIVYEGNICNIPTTSAKIQMLKDRGKEVLIQVLSADVDLAYENVLERESDCGRGATIQTIAYIISSIKPAILQLNEMFDIDEIGVIFKYEDNQMDYGTNGIEDVKRMPDYNREWVVSYLKAKIEISEREQQL